MRILVMGNLRGARPSDEGLAAARILRVDVDEFEDVLGRIGPHASLTFPDSDGTPLEIDFSEIEDFEPDSLWRRLPVFAELRGLRKRLKDPATFAAAAKELEGPAPAAPTAEPAPEGEGREESGEDTLERLLGARPADVSGGGRRGGVDLSGFIRSIVAPHVVPDPDPRQDQMIASVDDAAASLMQRILHHPQFRALEAAWRSLWGLVSGVETDETLSIHVLDVSREELETDLNAAGGDLERWALYRMLVERGAKMPGGEGWSLLVGDYIFGPETADVALLGALGVLASQAGGPFVAGASPRFLGTDALTGIPDPKDWAGLPEVESRRWNAMRSAPMAPWLGLALPRVLLRLPYGPDGEEIDAFAFDELGPERPHEAYLWGNPAFGVAKLLATSFTNRGAEMSPGDHLELADLPAVSFRNEDGEACLVPVAEANLTETAGEKILGTGLMPLHSLKNRNAARFLRIQSISEPPAPLRLEFRRAGGR